MTLVVALACSDGLVLACDSAASFNEGVQQPTAKIRPLGNWGIWGSAGHEGMSQEFEARLLGGLGPNCEKPDSAAQFTDVLQQAMSVTASTWLNRVVHANAPNYTDTPVCHALFLAKFEGSFCIIEVEPNACVGRLEHYGHAAIGSGALWAKAALYPVRGKRLVVDQAKPLAFKVLEEAIDGLAGGLAPPVRIWTLEERDGSPLVSDELQNDPEERARWRLASDTLTGAFEETLGLLGVSEPNNP